MIDTIYERKYGKKNKENGKVEVHLTPEQEKKIKDRVESRVRSGRVID